MFCTKCGARLDEGQKFCGMCGNTVIQEQVTNNSGQTWSAPVGSAETFSSQVSSQSVTSASAKTASKSQEPVYMKAEYTLYGKPRKRWQLGIIWLSILAVFDIFSFTFIDDYDDQSMWVMLQIISVILFAVVIVLVLVEVQTIRSTYLKVYPDKIEGQALTKGSNTLIYSTKRLYAESNEVISVRSQGKFLEVSTKHDSYYYFIESTYELGNALESLQKYIQRG